jgi:Sec-independent protein translocase protein TatA
MLALIAVVAVAFTGCKKKEPTLSERLSGAAEDAKKAASDAAKAAEKAGEDAKKSVDKVMEK